MLFEATKLVVICYGSNRKLIQLVLSRHLQDTHMRLTSIPLLSSPSHLNIILYSFFLTPPTSSSPASTAPTAGSWSKLYCTIVSRMESNSDHLLAGLPALSQTPCSLLSTEWRGYFEPQVRPCHYSSHCPAAQRETRVLHPTPFPTDLTCLCLPTPVSSKLSILSSVPGHWSHLVLEPTRQFPALVPILG